MRARVERWTGVEMGEGNSHSLFLLSPSPSFFLPTDEPTSSQLSSGAAYGRTASPTTAVPTMIACPARAWTDPPG